jgi:hypothetical protein
MASDGSAPRGRTQEAARGKEVSGVDGNTRLAAAAWWVPNRNWTVRVRGDALRQRCVMMYGAC